MYGCLHHTRYERDGNSRLYLPAGIQKGYPNNNTPDPATLSLSSDTTRTLSTYLNSRWKDTDALFPSRSAERMSTQSSSVLLPKELLARCLDYMTVTSDSETVDPNKLADRYEATQNLYSLLNQVVDSWDKSNTKEHVHILEYCERLDELSRDLGDAQRKQNSFYMEEDYRPVHDDLPTLETGPLTIEERALLVEVGAVDWNEEIHLPVDDSGERLPLLVSSTEEIEKALDTLDGYRQYISNESVKILHVADTHLGFSHRYTKRSGGYTPNYKVDCLKALEKVVDVAMDENVDAVVHAGDVFDHYVEEEDIENFKNCVDNLRENGISFHFVIGDHDAQTATYGGEKAVSELFRMSERGEIEILDEKPSVVGDDVVSLYGLGDGGKGIDEWEFQKEDWKDGERDKGWWDDPNLNFEQESETSYGVLCLHGKFRTDGEDMLANDIVEKSNLNFDKLFLGDLHYPMDGVGGCDDAHYVGPTQSISRSKKDAKPRVNIFEFNKNGGIEQEWEVI